MKKKILLLVIAAVVIAAGVGTAVVRTQSNDDTAADQIEAAADSDVNDESQIDSETDTSSASDDASSSTSSETNETAESEGTEASSAAGGISSGGSGSSGNNPSVSVNGNASGSSNSTISGDSNVMSFPFTSTKNQLTIDAIYNYQGYYLEDGSDEEVGSVAMIQLTNTSDKTIELATVHMTGGGAELTFVASLIPAGATVLVMDANRTAYTEGSDCTYEGAEIAYITDYSLHEELISISKDESGTITVQNITGADIPEIRLFYKNKMDTGEYVGGIAYTVKVENLAAGASVQLNPAHFDPTYGEILMVRTYEESTAQ